MTKSTPSPPYFEVSEKQHWIDCQFELAAQIECNLLALVTFRERDWKVYDAAGAVWSVRWERAVDSYPWFVRLLAHTFYNPRRTAKVTWTRIGEYELEDLRQAYLDAIKHDDDILTQWVDRDELNERVARAPCFRTSSTSGHGCRLITIGPMTKKIEMASGG